MTICVRHVIIGVFANQQHSCVGLRMHCLGTHLSGRNSMFSHNFQSLWEWYAVVPTLFAPIQEEECVEPDGLQMICFTPKVEQPPP